MSRDRLKDLVLSKLGSLQQLARLMEINPQTLSNKLHQSNGKDFTKAEKVMIMVLLKTPYNELWGEKFEF